VALVFADETGREAAWVRRRDFVRSVLPYVPARSFDASHVRPYFHVALYGNGAKVDYRFEAQNVLQPNPRDGEIRILKDTAGWGEALQKASARMVPTQPRIEAAELERLDNRFWVMFMDVYRQLWRGDSDKPFAVYLELLHFTLPPLLHALPEEDPAYQGLTHAFYSRETGATLNQMDRLLDAYLAARSAVIRRHNVGYIPDTSFERSLRRLIMRRSP
jgi:hypothetical protein